MLGVNVAGVTVNKKNAIGQSAVWACVKILSETIASVPFEVFIKDDKGVRPATDHYLYHLINASPSSLYTSLVFRETLQSHLCLDGNAYARIHRTPGGFIDRFEILQPGDVEIHLVDGELMYKVRQEGKNPVILFPSEIIHIPALGFNGIKGMNPIEVQRKSLGTGIAAQDFGLNFYGKGFNGIKGMNPIEVQRKSLGTGIAAQDFGLNFYGKGAQVSGALEFPQKLTPEQKNRLAEQLQSQYSGPENVGKTLILENGMKYTPIGIKPADANFIETKKFQIEEVARMFRVPLHLLGALDNATYNNVEQLNINFAIYTLYPWVKRWEQEFKRKIFTTQEIEAGYFVRFNLNSLMRGDSEARARFYRELFTIQAINPNEIRALENMNPYEGGDEYGLPLASNIKTIANESTEQT